ncbi:MAG TPA: zf-HC2 domain-containing protein [Gemmatimonadales bacterium]|jgi:hypothetical protein|nr:zf-HC2 domain-containing protein [Gemmatimonadales bacterium]
MSHLEDGVLHALLDGEIPSPELAPIQAHLETCAECRARLEEERAIRGEADGLVGALEVPPASEGPGPGAGARRLRAKPPRFRARDLAWAATIVVAAGLGYAARGVRPALNPNRFAASDDAAARQTRRDAATTAPAESAVTPARRDSPTPAPAEAVVPAAVLSSPAPEKDRQTAAPGQKLADRAATRKDSTADGRVTGGDASPARREAAAARTEERAADVVQRTPPKGANELLQPNPASAARPGVVAPAAPAGAAAGQIRLRGARQLDTSSLRLEELVVTGVPERAARRSLPFAVGAMAKANDSVPLVLSFPDAIARLGGTLRLIEGLVPLRVEALGARVRVIYVIAGGGELALEQWRSDTGLSWKLSAPPGFPADSLQRLTARVRE